MRPGQWPKGRSLLTRVAGVVLGVALAASSTAAPASPGPAGEAVRAARCGPVEDQFKPTALAIPGVVGRTRILAMGRDSRGVPRPPPLTDRGKWQFAWDKESRIRPGRRQGVVRLTAHTYPRFAGKALGNRLLARLRVGALIRVSGPAGQQLCYRVVKRINVPADQTSAAFYATTGPPRLAILVCSGKRRGPGDWSHRTIWFAAPEDAST